MNFYKNLPAWMVAVVDGKPCTECNGLLKKENIVGIGIKGTGDNKAGLWIEYQCKRCSHSARTSFTSYKTSTVEDICFLLIESMQKQRHMSKSKTNEEVKGVARWTQTEVDSFITQMNKSESFEDVLKLIGANGMVRDED